MKRNVRRSTYIVALSVVASCLVLGGLCVLYLRTGNESPDNSSRLAPDSEKLVVGQNQSGGISTGSTSSSAKIGISTASDDNGISLQAPQKVGGIPGTYADISLDEVGALVDNERTSAGLAALALSNKLSEAAQLKCADMVAYDYWSHVSPTGVEPWHWFDKVGYEYSSAGENLADGWSSASKMVGGWMNSKSHRDNILNAKYSEVGYAKCSYTAANTHQGVVVVQMLGDPYYK